MVAQRKKTTAFERLSSREGMNRFSGPASFRALARDQQDILQVIHETMAELVADVESVDIDIFLHQAMALDNSTEVLRVRLGWRVKGVNKRFTFIELEQKIQKLPAPVKAFLEWADYRASELNALESVFRSSVTMTKNFMSVGSVRQYSS
ncbi:hypothetical protein WM40_26450 [Robbsia andropogonis]|uniref:Uncharacterized protein n=1 Tax=Robbsia andropogonis TaxID=28092 RepID=A0A0F5JTD3_9BURK|nr:hypothetical protein [Robbsia andropogonis]KKB60900.1 hypothetical protein WM40_26450 [Robbsia andropogonis]